MSNFKIRLFGLSLMILGSFLFIWSVRDITSEWTQIFVGLCSVFCLSMGFGILIMPLETNSPSSNSESNPPA